MSDDAPDIIIGKPGLYRVTVTAKTKLGRKFLYAQTTTIASDIAQEFAASARAQGLDIEEM